MNKSWLLLLIGGLMFASCSDKNSNPFFEEYTTPFQTPPFDKIKLEHYMPAFQEGVKQEQQKVNSIANNPEMATFENTIEALENTGSLLQKVNAVFNNQISANTNDELQTIAKETQR